MADNDKLLEVLRRLSEDSSSTYADTDKSQSTSVQRSSVEKVDKPINQWLVMIGGAVLGFIGSAALFFITFYGDFKSTQTRQEGITKQVGQIEANVQKLIEKTNNLKIEMEVMKNELLHIKENKIAKPKNNN